MSIKILIVEDEVTAARRLARVLSETQFPHEVISIISSVEDAVNYFRFGNKPDLILMDIHLSDGSSFEIFNQVELHIPVIFITAYDEYAISAFKVNSIDYLLKPVKKEELLAALEKFRRNSPDVSVLDTLKDMFTGKQKYLRRFVIKSGSGFYVVETNEVALAYAEEKVVFVQDFQGKRHIVDYTLEKLMTLLDPTHFFRINRKVIVNIRSIKSISTWFRGKLRIVLHTDTPVDTIVSSAHSSAFRKWLEGGQ
jgi:two-component system, LytTR family, response regulator LytT